MKHLTRQETATAEEVLKQYNLTPAQRKQAVTQIEYKGAAAPLRFNAYGVAHAVAGNIIRFSLLHTITEAQRIQLQEIMQNLFDSGMEELADPLHAVLENLGSITTKKGC